jgi:predicted transcriptional regulator
MNTVSAGLLSADYPMVAPKYAEAQQIAKSLGLGTRPRRKVPK